MDHAIVSHTQETATVVPPVTSPAPSLTKLKPHGFLPFLNRVVELGDRLAPELD